MVKKKVWVAQSLDQKIVSEAKSLGGKITVIMGWQNFVGSRKLGGKILLVANF